MTKEKYLETIDRLKQLISGTEFENHTFAVGGCVRDEMLGEEHIKDIDIVVDLPDGGIRLARYFEQQGYCNGSAVVYETYGTAMFRLDDIEIECVQTRKEQYHDASSRNPETAYGTLYEDCMRRDLTINALYRNITTGEILDPCGKGRHDIEMHNIRVTSTPDIVYNDDPLRILRAIRFYCRFGSEWTLDADTLNGMEKNADRLNIITKERIQDELNKILLSNNPAMGIWMIYNIGAMKDVIPELVETYEMTQNDYHFGTVWQHTIKVLKEIDDSYIDNDSDLLVVRMAALLHDIGKIKTRTIDENGRVHFYKHELKGVRLVDTILRRLKYSNDFIRDVQFLTEHHMITKSWKDNLDSFKNEDRLFRAIRKLQYRCGRRRFNLLMVLIDADNKAHAPEHCMPNQVKNIRMVSEHMEYDGRDMFDYKMPVTGDDVMEYKGLKPGPDVRKYLDYMLKICFNNPQISKEQLLKSIDKLKPENL